ncbi:MAG TPA: sulfate adenylyltransferase subunit CysN [Candidatus Krumholzibacteria bacterium]|nr:sulfate adenylyltransferase subunit CysN [Candidatus Krumholzibacteria bacterium]
MSDIVGQVTVEELLRRNEESELLRFSTAGSVDDGKSTLIGRLLYDSKSIFEDHMEGVEAASKRLNRNLDLALLMDGLKSEREQGITIDVAYRYFSTPTRRFIIADTPGHEQYTRNMVTGASTANLSLVLIDAKNGITTQSKRHGFIASLLQIPHVVVVVNKMDLVDWSQERFDELRQEYSDFAAKLEIDDLSFIPVSALLGDNVVERSANMPWYQGLSLIQHLEQVHIAGDRNLIDLRLPIQYVNRPNHEFRGYCGTIASGVLRQGDEVMILPSGQTSRVSRIVTFDGDVEYAYPPQSITVCLEDERDISRGDMIVKPGNQPRVERQAEAMLVWMDEQPLQVGSPYLVRHSSAEVRGTVAELRYRVDPNQLHREDADALGLNEIGRVEMQFHAPLMLDRYSENRATGSFVLIDPLTHRTVGAGMIEKAGRRDAIAVAEPASRNITRHRGHVTPERRDELLGHRPATLWFTGLSGSGKSTVAFALEKRLVDMGHKAYVLDGDNVRHGLNRDLGFSPAERTENLRRIAEVAWLMNDAGLIVITSFIAPYRSDRQRAREVIGPDHFFEVHVDAPIEVCEQRDPKGLYAKARRGEIGDFTGVSAPYEAPEAPEVHLPTDQQSVDELVDRLVVALRRRGVIPETT